MPERRGFSSFELLRRVAVWGRTQKRPAAAGLVLFFAAPKNSVRVNHRRRSLRRFLRPRLKPGTLRGMPEVLVEGRQSDGRPKGLLKPGGRRELDGVIAAESILPSQRLG